MSEFVLFYFVAVGGALAGWVLAIGISRATHEHEQELYGAQQRAEGYKAGFTDGRLERSSAPFTEF